MISSDQGHVPFILKVSWVNMLCTVPFIASGPNVQSRAVTERLMDLLLPRFSPFKPTVTSSTIDLASGSTVLCVRIRTLCVIITHQTVNLTVSAICPRQRFLDCVLLVKKGVFLLNIYRNFCRLYSPIRDPGSIFKMHKIPAAQRPVHIIFPAYTQAL